MQFRPIIRRLAALGWLSLTPLMALAQGSTLQDPLGQNASFCSLIKNLLNGALVLGVPIAILFIVIAGARFVFARGNEAKLTGARENLLYTIIGIAIFFGAWLITGVIVNTVNQFHGITIGTC